MAAIADRNPCSCGNTDTPIFYSHGTQAGYEGIYFVVGQPYQGARSPRREEPASKQRPRQLLGEIDANRADAVDYPHSQAPTAIVNPVVTVHAHISVSPPESSQRNEQKHAPPPPPPPPAEEDEDSPEETTGFAAIVDALKSFHKSGVKLRPAKDRVLGPPIKRSLRRTQSMSAKSNNSKVIAHGKKEGSRFSSGSSDNADNGKPDSCSDEDARSMVMDAVKRRIPAVRGDGNSSQEDELEHDWE